MTRDCMQSSAVHKGQHHGPFCLKGTFFCQDAMWKHYMENKALKPWKETTVRGKEWRERERERGSELESISQNTSKSLSVRRNALHLDSWFIWNHTAWNLCSQVLQKTSSNSNCCHGHCHSDVILDHTSRCLSIACGQKGGMHGASAVSSIAQAFSSTSTTSTTSTGTLPLAARITRVFNLPSNSLGLSISVVDLQIIAQFGSRDHISFTCQGSPKKKTKRKTWQLKHLLIRQISHSVSN